MTKRKLPIGIQTFREVREDNCYYVDKTAYLRRLLDEGKHFFLSRPRRFGKSLFLDTCKELFESNERLFEGLYIHDRWDWSVRHPVPAPRLQQRHLPRAGRLARGNSGATERLGGGSGDHPSRWRHCSGPLPPLDEGATRAQRSARCGAGR